MCLWIIAIERNRYVDCVLEEYIQESVVDVRCVSKYLDEFVAPGGRERNHAGKIGMQCGLAPDELHLLTAKICGVAQYRQPIVDSHLSNKMPPRPRIGVTMDAFQIALWGYLQPQKR